MPTRAPFHHGLAYWPAAQSFVALLAAMFIVALAIVEFGLVNFAYHRLGLSPLWAFVVLAGSLVGSAVNIPVRRLPSHVEPVQAVVSVWGVRYIVPAWVRTGETLVAVNVGGAVIPCLLSAYLFVHDHLGWAAVAAIGFVTVVAYVAARPVAGVGVVVPTLVPPAAAVLAAIMVAGESPAAIAFVAGTLGTLIGADLLHLRQLPRLGAPVMSIGGAGTFDGIFVAGIVAVVLAGL